ncbi:MAG: hypothetical protein V7K25_16550 [Nostoc sp.]|uniref:hypothetical protein n=1 Tax=Nostoc sp. TaxID=1180 RepID=UPI002FF49564
MFSHSSLKNSFSSPPAPPTCLKQEIPYFLGIGFHGLPVQAYYNLSDRPIF